MKRIILRTLRHTNNNRRKAAEILGISVRTIHHHINTSEELSHLKINHSVELKGDNYRDAIRRFPVR